jgi:NADPH-dependent 2,4-dienoyl-CoA reductase/sulfur reductase-like enzyme
MSTTSIAVDRRRALCLLAGGAAVGIGRPSLGQGAAGRVVVVGGGFGGATAARYIRRLDPAVEVTLIEPADRFYTCPFTNLYLGGLRDFESLGHGFDDLRRAGVRVVHAMAEDVDTAGRSVRLSTGDSVPYDRLILSPGIDIRWGALEGYDETAAEKAPHAWKAGPQTKLLRGQLEAMEDGGLFVLVAPANPFRCPPGPYERVSMVAHYLKTNKPRSKILVLDAKDQFSKQGLFTDAWAALYGDMIEWVGLSQDGKVVRVDADTLEVETEFGRKQRAAVLNVVPPQKAGFIADRAGVTDDSGWVPVVPATFASPKVEHVYVVGDATIAAPMPKSGFCANTQAKVVAAAVVADLAGRAPPAPVWVNTCYSLIAPEYGISVAGVYRVLDGKIAEVEGSGGVSPRDADAAFRKREADYGAGWYAAISADIWGA